MFSEISICLTPYSKTLKDNNENKSHKEAITFPCFLCI